MVSPIPITRQELTGGQRFRVVRRWVKADLVILQVEVRTVYFCPVSERITATTITWRDAVPDDLMQHPFTPKPSIKDLG